NWIFPSRMPKSIVVTTAWAPTCWAILSDAAEIRNRWNGPLRTKSLHMSLTETLGRFRDSEMWTKFSGLSTSETPMQARSWKTKEQATKTIAVSRSIGTVYSLPYLGKM